MNGKSCHGYPLKVEIVDTRKTRKTGPKPEDGCFRCGKKGHW